MPHRPDDHAAREARTGERPGDLIGPYKLLEQIGEGGCGTVWAAEQREPLKRRVAVKVLKLGMDTRKTLARFAAERQALALMDHPNIAKVLDAGASPSGRPYFVMELVKGVPITDFCDGDALSIKARLVLFIDTCLAIQHAHQKGIIHRDIKPSNVLVTLHDGKPVPKVIDFGIAKATQQELTENTVYTRFAEFIGTPAYMSPEQAELSGLDIDTRSDVYSLGVLMYELLTGSTPFDTKELLKSGLGDLRRVIREQEPPKPSTRITGERTKTRQRARGRTRDLRSELRGDLDCIVMKCLEKERNRRYDTANALVMDIRRHLGHEPILARPPSAGYRLIKSWKRNRAAFTAATIVGVSLVLATTWSIHQAREATVARNLSVAAQAQKEVERKRAVEAQQTALRNLHEAELRRYASDVSIAHAAIAEDNLGRARLLLDQLAPERDGDEDLRGFEWRYLMGLARGAHQRAVVVSPAAIFWSNLAPTGDVLLFTSSRSSNRTLVQSADFHAATVTDSPIPSTYRYSHGPDEDSIVLWNLGDGQLELRDRSGQKTTFRLDHVIGPPSPDRRWVVTRPPGGLATLVDLAARGPAGTLPVEARYLQVVEPEHWVLAVDGAWDRWRASGARLVTLRDDGRTLPLPEITTAMPAYSPVSKRLVVGAEQGEVIVFDLLQGKELFRRVVTGGSAAFVDALAISPDGRTAAAATWEAVVALIDLGSGDMRYLGTGRTESAEPVLAWRDRESGSMQYVGPADGENSELRPVGRRLESETWSLEFTRDGSTLVTGHKDGHVRFWNVRHSTVVQPHSLDLPRGLSMRQVAFSERGDLLAVAAMADDGGANEIRVYDSGDLTLRLSLQARAVPVAFADDDRTLVTVDREGMSHWDLLARKVTLRYDLPTARSEAGLDPERAVVDPSRRALLVPDGVTGAVLVRLDDGAIVRTLSDLQMSEGVAAVSRDLQRIAVDRDHVVEIRSFTGADGVSGVLRGRHAGRLHSLAFTPNGRGLIAGSHGDLVYRELEPWTETALHGHLSNTIVAVAVSRDGRTAASLSKGRIVLWNLRTRREVVSLSCPGFGEELLLALTFDPTGRYLAVLQSADRTRLRLVEAPSFEEIEAARPAALRRVEGGR